MFYQVEVRALGKQFDVGSAAVDSILEVHLIPKHQHNNNSYLSSTVEF